jgi:uncharacterized repeat protein (TIGR02543 family)
MKGAMIMRETTIKRVFGILGIFALTILFLSCPDEPVQEQQDKAMVSFSVMDTARTVLPQVSLADVASYELLGGLNSAAETVLVESFTGTGTSVFLESGTWNFTLNAYNSAGGHILQGKTAQTISLGTNQVSFSLSPVNSGTGAIQITLNFPESAGITRIVVKNDTNSENFMLTNSDSFVYSKNGIAAGDYLISFELYRGDILRAVVSELVLVRSNLTSSKTITLAGENLKPLLTVEISLTGLDEWEMIEQTAQAAVNVNKIFTVTGTYTTYRWYLDGTQVGTSSSYTFSKPAGVYQLVVAATNSAGLSRSGRCRITVASPLTAHQWADGNITDASSEDWYSFPVTANTTYRIWWNDRKEGDETQSGDVAVSARYENETAFIFGGTDTTVDSGWITAQSFTANQTGRVFIRVIPYNRSNANTGTYRIVYSTSTNRPAIYTVTFDINDGSGTTPDARTVISDSDIPLPDGSGFSRDGYKFGGWNTLANGTGTNYNAGASYTPTGDITFYARWYHYAVIFDTNGGSGTPPATQMVNSGSSITLPSGLSRGTYNFEGWNTLANGTGTNYSAGSSYTPTDDIIFYARWTSIVTFNINGGSGTTPATQTVNAGSSIFLPGGNGFSRDGYIFGGWFTNTGIAYSAGTYFTPTGNVTLYARWYLIYTVTFNINSGTGTTPAAQTGSEVSPPITLPDGSGFSRDGYTFGGWNTLADGSGTSYDAGSSYTPTGDIILYAKWNRIGTYVVLFLLNGGSGTAPATQTVYAGSSITLPDGSGFSRDDHTFAGWSATGLGVLTAGSSYTPTGDTIFSAVWYPGTGTVLTQNVWANGSISSAYGEVVYLFPAYEYIPYHIWWNDRSEGNGTKTGDVVVSVRYRSSTGVSAWFFGGTSTTVTDGWNEPLSFRASRTETVEIRVILYNRSIENAGTFGIVYSIDYDNSPTRPALP